MKKFKQTPLWQSIFIGLVISTVITLIFDYLLPTPWNFRSEATWFKAFFVFALYAFINAIVVSLNQGTFETNRHKKLIILPFALPAIMIPAFFICMITGAEFFNAKNYANIIQVEHPWCRYLRQGSAHHVWLPPSPYEGLCRHRQNKSAYPHRSTPCPVVRIADPSAIHRFCPPQTAGTV